MEAEVAPSDPKKKEIVERFPTPGVDDWGLLLVPVAVVVYTAAGQHDQPVAGANCAVPTMTQSEPPAGTWAVVVVPFDCFEWGRVHSHCLPMLVRFLQTIVDPWVDMLASL